MSEILLKGADPNSIVAELEVSAVMERNSRVQLAKAITVVANNEDLQKAVNVCNDLKDMVKEVEKTRKAVKAPVLLVEDRIDSAAKTFIKPVKDELERITVLNNKFAQEQERKRQEEERRRQEETARIQREKEQREAEQRRKDEELRKQQEEAERKAREARGRKAREEAEKQAEELRQKRLAEQAVTDTAASNAELMLEQLNQQVVQPPPKIEGMTKRRTPKFEVLSIQKLVKARPELCEIKPCASEINAAIMRGETDIPGLRVWIADEIK